MIIVDCYKINFYHEDVNTALVAIIIKYYTDPRQLCGNASMNKCFSCGILINQ